MEIAVRAAADVETVEEQLVPTRDRHAVRRPKISGMTEHEAGGHGTTPQERPRPVQVGEDGIEKPRTLEESRFEVLPFVGREEKRYRVDLPPRRSGGEVRSVEGL